MNNTHLITLVQSKLDVSESLLEKLSACTYEAEGYFPHLDELKKIKFATNEIYTCGTVELTVLDSNGTTLNKTSVATGTCFLFTCIRGKFGLINDIWNTCLS